MIVNPLPLFSEIKEIIIQSRQRVFRMANSALLETYWQIGKIIVKTNSVEKNGPIMGNQS